MAVIGYEVKRRRESTLCMEFSEVPLTTVNAPTAVNPAEEKCTRARRNISCNHPRRQSRGRCTVTSEEEGKVH